MRNSRWLIKKRDSSSCEGPPSERHWDHISRIFLFCFSPSDQNRSEWMSNQDKTGQSECPIRTYDGWSFSSWRQLIAFLFVFFVLFDTDGHFSRLNVKASHIGCNSSARLLWKHDVWSASVTARFSALKAVSRMCYFYTYTFCTFHLNSHFSRSMSTSASFLQQCCRINGATGQNECLVWKWQVVLSTMKLDSRFFNFYINSH